MSIQKKRVIPTEYIPEVGSHIETIDDQDYLITNDAMYTFYQRTKGEFSPFFLSLRDEKKLLGCKCSKCGLVRVPPFLTHCPDCNFAPTELIEVEQVGIMNSTPPITYFATSLFQHMAPYGRGRVIFNGADTAMSVILYTTTGILVPGIITKGTEVKLIFKDNRIGEMTDVFCVPTRELTQEQVNKKGLQESEIDWESPVEPEFPEVSDKDVADYNAALKEIKSIIEEMNANERARKDIAGWKRDILIKTMGGRFAISIDDGNIELEERELTSPDFVMVCENPRTLLDGLAYKGAITDSVINKKLWISKNMEFNTIFKLDRMARSVARSKKI
ncbi:MAG: zinc ribbon domain-containing protein [Desulfobacterales bacterium]|nr:zinc ribbon domain-containing protein [Desulfobacterales bacterium]